MIPSVRNLSYCYFMTIRDNPQGEAVEDIGPSLTEKEHSDIVDSMWWQGFRLLVQIS